MAEHLRSACRSQFVICKVVAARLVRKLITARARKNKRTARKCSQRPFDSPLLLVFSVTPFKIDQNKSQNRSIPR